MAKPLLDRVSADLKPTGRIADCKRDLAEAEQERAGVDEKIADAVNRSEDLSASDEDAKLALQQAEDWRLYARRLDKAIGELRQALAQKLADEGYLLRRKEFDAAQAERDALAERWRAFARHWEELGCLITDTRSNDELLDRVNVHRPQGAARLVSAELVARGALNENYWPNSIGQNGEPFTRLISLRLPRFDRPGELVSNAARELGAAVAQSRYRGHPVIGIAHRGGLCAVGNVAECLWMDDRQAAAAREAGLKLERAPEVETVG